MDIKTLKCDVLCLNLMRTGVDIAAPRSGRLHIFALQYWINYAF